MVLCFWNNSKTLIHASKTVVEIQYHSKKQSKRGKEKKQRNEKRWDKQKQTARWQT